MNDECKGNPKLLKNEEISDEMDKKLNRWVNDWRNKCIQNEKHRWRYDGDNKFMDNTRMNEWLNK